MDEFIQHSAEELILNESFRTFVLYPTRVQQAEFEKWITEHPEQREKLMSAAEAVRTLRVPQASLSPDEHADAISQIFEQTTQKRTVRRIGSFFYYGAAAAVLAVIIGFNFLPDHFLPFRDNLTENNIRIPVEGKWRSNDSRYTQLIKLPDGSSVFLKPDSQIRYPEVFDSGAKNVELKGEAFFEVTSDIRRPFHVYAAKSVTKVLGTSFHVNSRHGGEAVTVSVVSGKVKVALNTESGTSALLTDGQQASVSGTGQVTTSGFLNEEMMNVFLKTISNGARIDVPRYLTQVRAAFGIEIEFDKKELGNCTVNANFQGMHLTEQLDAICKAIGARYQVRDGMVVISSKGC